MLVISNIPGVKGLDRAKAADIPTKVSVCIGFMTIYYYYVKLNNNIENDNNVFYCCTAPQVEWIRALYFCATGSEFESLMDYEWC